ncbi:hypothetical protein HGH92_21200 [Chitinophaga varians]|uniref:Uncharacterized protein n=1 Tax=Chitinophaga varians TaxID=2202339 RepID=A0A847RIH1_9BACT|nr:hypothetical protein [Chitinophaga varians]
MDKTKIRIFLVCLFLSVFSSVIVTVKARTLDRVWIVDINHTDAGCTLALQYYTLEPNGSPMFATYASTTLSAQCDYKMLYTGE